MQTTIRIVFLLFTSLFFFSRTNSAFAQVAQGNLIVETRVGNPVEAPQSQELSSVLQWDTQIVDSLSRGIWNYLNKLTTNISNNTYSTGTWAGTNEGNVYWCTYSIIDSYRLAGIQGLSKSSHAAVVTMRNFWKTSGVNTLEFKYVDYPANNRSISDVKPGYAIFMERTAGSFTGYEHVAMVKSISIDQNGNGFLESQDSNSSTKTHRFPIAEYSVKGTPYPIRGFGGS